MTRGIIDMLLWRRGAPGRDPVNQQIDTSNENQEDHFQFQDLFLLDFLRHQRAVLNLGHLKSCSSWLSHFFILMVRLFARQFDEKMKR